MSWQEHWNLYLNLGILLGVNGFVVLMCVPFYAFVYRHRKRDREIAARNPTAITNQFFREYWFWLTDPLLRLLMYIRMHPNHITAFSTSLGVLAGIAMFYGMIALGGWIMIFSTTLDTMDGRIARAYDLDTSAGAFFDSVMDRYADFAILAGVILHFSFMESNASGAELIVILALLSLLGANLISYSKERGMNLGVSETRGLMQRADRVMVLALGACFDPLVQYIVNAKWGAYHANMHYSLTLALVLIAVLGNRTAITRIRNIFRKLQNMEGLSQE